MENNGNEMEMLERRFQGAMARMQRRLRATWMLALVGAFVLGGNPEARAQTPLTLQSLQNQINNLKTQVNAQATQIDDQATQINNQKTRLNNQATQISGLSSQVSSLTTQVSNQNAQISNLSSQVSSLSGQVGGQNNLTARMAGVEAKTAPISVSGSSFVITGKNVFIQDGTGVTNSTSGLGNLTVGYNASRSSGDVRTGSHNLLLGDRNNYSASGGLVAGYFNSIGGTYATVTGGEQNDANSYRSSVSGGYNRDIIPDFVIGPSVGPLWRAGTLPESN